MFHAHTSEEVKDEARQIATNYISHHSRRFNIDASATRCLHKKTIQRPCAEYVATVDVLWPSQINKRGNLMKPGIELIAKGEGSLRLNFIGIKIFP